MNLKQKNMMINSAKGVFAKDANSHNRRSKETPRILPIKVGRSPGKVKVVRDGSSRENSI